MNPVSIYFPGGSYDKVFVYNEVDLGSMPGWRKSSGGGKWQPHWRGSCLESSMDGEVWWAFSPWVFAESDMTEQLHFHFHYRVTYCFSHALLYDPMDCSKLGLPSLAYLSELPKLMSIQLGCYPIILPSSYILLPSVFPNIRVFSNQSALRIRWPKYWSFSISLSNEYSGLISFRIDSFDLEV